MKKQLITLALTTLAFGQLMAQTNDLYTYTEPKIKTDNTQVFVDGIAILLKGFGVKATKQIQRNLGVGGTVSMYKLDSDSSSSTKSITSVDFKNEVTAVSAIADYYLGYSATESGGYLSGGIIYSKLKSAITDTYGFSKDFSDSKVGVVGKAGYQILNKISSDQNLILQLGLGFGSGNAVQTKYSSINGVVTTAESKLVDGMTIDINAGLQF